MTMWGPEVGTDGRTLFRLWAPDRKSVTLEFDGGETLAMTEAGGWFTVHAAASAGTRYRFRLDADLVVPDPASRLQAGGVHGWSVVAPPLSGSADEWRGRPWEEAVIQEVHVGALGGFTGVADALPAMAELGITAVELMPIGAFAGTRNWGYDGVLPFAPAEAYGSPQELRALVKRAHEFGMMILLDVVYNHFGPDGNFLGAYASGFFHARDTPWGGAVAVDRPEVAAYFRENALMWIEDYGFDGLRFDAVHAIDNPKFLDALATDIRAAVPDRSVHLILENEENDADRLSGGRYDAQWNDDFHNVLHVLLTGESEGYYAAFSEDSTGKLARCLGEGFIYQGEGMPHQDGRPRGKPSGHLPPTAFVSFLQNHDQVGNRALGERLTTLVAPERLRAAAALLLLSPQIPLLFMGDETGSRTPFFFFTDFHDELADIVREGRRKEFAHFAAFASKDARAQIPDPNAETTLENSRPVPGEDSEDWRGLYRELLALRHAEIVPRLRGSTAQGARVLGQGAVEAAWTLGDGAVLTVALNIGDVAVDVRATAPWYSLGTPGAPASFAAWLEPNV
ncbi:malto-oligosyltrehalose trehalohydrolase [Sphingomonas sp. GC_Shp_3]|uniref:malto-oligosyltrehalose trehalohydrolase n=1 Tax=Sphingomonas sp. GC_Shp_3 TaxID=2937383 RepID=UPI002269F9F4|nr:malto-oligosyltrehalose trehalohydrolase [Sphingomonas sp. GC_Shp_3]